MNPSHEWAGIRPAMHPAWRRCSSLEYRQVFAVVAPCQPGASPASVRARRTPQSTNPDAVRAALDETRRWLAAQD